MLSTFFGLEIARRALNAEQAATDVTGHNIANASAPGYSRQRADQVASDPYTIPSLGSPVMAQQVGTGVMVSQIERIRDSFLDGQYREQNSLQGQYQIISQTLNEVQTIFLDPSANGLNPVLDNFFNSWQELSKNAESMPIRTSLLGSAETLCATFNNISSQLKTAEDNLAATSPGPSPGTDLLVADVNKVNKIASQINDLNTQIIKIKGMGEQPNDLLDQRDNLLDQLSQLMNITVTQESNDGIKVTFGSANATLITTTASATVNTLSATATLSAGGALTISYHLYNPSNNITASGSISNTGGELTGIENAYENIISYQQNMDKLAKTLISAVNYLHAKNGLTLKVSAGGTITVGSAGGTFFTGSAAGNIQVNAQLLTYPNLVAAASAGATTSAIGSAGNALAMANLQNSAILNGATFDGYYQSIVTGIGSDTQRNSQLAANQQTLVDQVNNLRQSVSGVNMDEEMTNLMQYQHGYQAAARLVTVLDDMLDTLINKMG
ncbi:flagellar hook-associated protein FlgK [Desulfotomaculum copahuensis]|uniref:Flagellar hook-associated protein 1 n=1 Tax=Desulfotomaculum copahuensis TaxID=1838280 RepID=A0A1B7LCC5_9FIRM|nr:flagellar hook-associated protein FlgK [Desulfotomaculum copahuensis]OAT80373.1 flagellar hook-associated protein FlgK [Desulfotomaculum copahuensis]